MSVPRIIAQDKADSQSEPPARFAHHHGPATRAIAYIRALSRSLYVWNNFFVYLEMKWFVSRFPINYVGSFLVAFLSYRYSEKSIMKLKGKLRNEDFTSVAGH